MGREVRRVAMGFDWPLNQVWVGFLNPYWSDFRKDCPDCGGTGNSPDGRRLHDQWYGDAPFSPEMTGSTPFLPTEPYIVELARRNTAEPGPWNYGFDAEAQRLADHFNRSWMHHLDADDVQALIDGGRLRRDGHRARYSRLKPDSSAASRPAWIMPKRSHKPALKVPSFAEAFRASPAARAVTVKTQRAYEDGLLPHIVRMLFAYPALYEALGVDVRRMSGRERAAVRESLRSQDSI